MGSRAKSQSKIEHFRDRLKAARSHAGLTQSELSARAEISGVTLSKLEQGVNTPTLEVLLSICDALDSSPNFMVGWESLDAANVDQDRRSLVLTLEAAIQNLPKEWLRHLLALAEQIDTDRKN